jgi:hypothetical protein
MVREQDQIDFPEEADLWGADTGFGRIRLKGLDVLSHPFRSLIKCGAVLPSQMNVARFP